MTDAARLSKDDVRAATRLANLNLPDDRLDQLVTTVSAYLDNLDRLRQVETGDSEPPVITFESEGQR